MTVCLYKCLTAAGLQRHYARFTLMGVCQAAHLSDLRIEDYRLLGVCSMEDRARLFQLVQLVKSVGLRSLTDNDVRIYNDSVYEGGDEIFPANNISSFSLDGYGNPNGDVRKDNDESEAFTGISNASCYRPSCIRRRLDFSTEIKDQRFCSHFEGPIHVCSSHNRNDNPIHEDGSTPPIQLGLHCRSAVGCVLQHSKNSKLNGRNYLCDPHNGESIKLHITQGSSEFNSYVRLKPKSERFNKYNPSLAAATSESFINKLSAQKDRKTISRKKNASADVTKPTPVYKAERTAGYNYGLPLSSPRAAKHVEGQRIRVCVRKRPLTRAECRRGEADVVYSPSEECVVVCESKEAVDLTEYILQHRFYFDQVFGEGSSNEEVYQKTAYPLVQHMLSGGKATCFAYGQTGAGKTHTMLGSSSSGTGLYALAVQDIFAHLSAINTALLVYVSFFEIYCGQLYDLLEHRKRLFAREDGNKVVHISGLREVRVDSVSSLLEVISKGTAERTQGMSGVNPLSSRSHALLQIQIRDLNQQIAGRMWFVDLAGSERASDAKDPNKLSRMEGAEINQSLLALKECIRSLDKEESHTPFRQSKLTQVLKDSFVGDSMTCMIANISPGHSATEHTLNTLRYADRVKELRGEIGPIGRRTRSSKMGPSDKNMSDSSSSNKRNRRNAGTSKNAELGGQNKYFSPKMPTRPHTWDTVFCSTPKKRTCGEETQSRHTQGTEIEHITPIQGYLAQNECRCLSKGPEVREDGRTENKRSNGIHSHCVKRKHTRAVGMLRQQNKGAGGNLTFSKKDSGFYHREKENHQQTMKGRRREEPEWTDMRRQAESCRDTCRGEDGLKENEVHKADDNEKVRHLREYHQQLQQFLPSTTSSSAHPLSSSTCPSYSSSSRVSLPSLLDSSHFSCFTHVDPCLEETTDVLIETSANKHKSMTEVDKCESERKEVDEAAGKVTMRKEDMRLAGRKGGEIRCCWVESTQQIPTNTEARLSFSHDSEDQRDVGLQRLETRDIAWSLGQKEMSDCYSRNRLFDSPHLQAIAGRPLSPVCEDTSKMSVLPQDDTHRDRLSCIMDPLSISQLHVDQQAAVISPRTPHSVILEMNTSAKSDTATVTGHHEQQKYIPTTVSSRGTNKPSSPKDHNNNEKKQPTLKKNITASIIKPWVSSFIQSTDHSGSNFSCNTLEYAYNMHSKTFSNISKQTSEPLSGYLNLAQPNYCNSSKVVAEPNNPAELGSEENSNQQIKPTIHLFTMDRLDHARLCIIEAHLEQLKEMEAICHKEGELLCQQHDMV
ncbi:hypothetical protein CHARACLAT_023136 [Characodon lateralis]|uniref:Kinesin motor domain-containing protein n=1 Tax=Characodon lateralis TaxID=208331 RepID=A0ABU7EP97_9TELE|nr:hypothetical protein [Characodon lateralis]